MMDFEAVGWTKQVCQVNPFADNYWGLIAEEAESTLETGRGLSQL